MKWEWTREEEFIGATTRHQMTTRVKIGARKDGTLTALDVEVFSNTGAYGGHGGETLGAAMASPIAAYRCVNKRGIGHAVYTNMTPAGGFRGYGASQTTFAIECAIDELARMLGIDPFDDAAQERGAAGRQHRIDLEGAERRELRQLRHRRMPRHRRARAAERATASPSPRARTGPRARAWRWPCWNAGRRPSIARAPRCGSLPDGTYHLACGSTEMGNGITTAHKQIAASVLGTRAEDIDIINADTDRTPYDTGTFASTGTVVGGKAVHLAAAGDGARTSSTSPAAMPACRSTSAASTTTASSAATSASRCATSMPRARRSTTASRSAVEAYLSPRTIAFNVQGVRLAVHRVTGEIRVLHSVHAADIGRPINPMQCRGQLDGAVAMGYGWALVENMVHDEQGHMVNPQLRNCRIPTFADTPHTDIFFADTIDRIGPLGAKSQGECGINPVAPAVSNALADATGRALRPPAVHARPAVREARRRVMSAARVQRQHRHADLRAAGERRGLRALAGRDQRGDRRRSRASSSSA